MEEQGRGHATPHVTVRFMTHLSEDDPALERIGLVIERELQEGMRREILSAIRRAVWMQMAEWVGQTVCRTLLIGLLQRRLTSLDKPELFVSRSCACHACLPPFNC